MLFPASIACIDATLREVDFGTWEGCTAAAIQASQPAAWAARRANPITFSPPGGERLDEVRRRLAGVAAELRSAHGLRAVVGHRTCLGVLERMLRGLPLGDVSIAGLEPGSWRIISDAM